MWSNDDVLPLSPPDTDELMEPRLSSQNYDEILTTHQITWFVDDNSVHRVTANMLEGNNLTTKPTTNGALFILCPTNGQLLVKVIHSSVWAGRHQDRCFSAVWKTSEEVAAILRRLPYETQPKQIIVTREGMLDPLEIHLLGFPYTLIRGSELHLPFHALLEIERVGGVVSKATESLVDFFNVYDDWLESVSPYAAFSRLVLILRAIDVDKDKARMLLKPDDGSVVAQPNRVWPSLTDDQWMRVEAALRDLIVSDYAEKNNVKVWDLTQPEIRDIILGGFI